MANSQAPTAPQIREMIAGEIASFQIPPEKVHKLENRKVWTGQDSIPIRIYYPNAKKNSRIIFNIHGGALVAGDLDTHDNISRVLSNNCQAIVVALDYRKPPEAPYPAGLGDCRAVLNWILQQAASLGGDKKHIVVLGDSGGGLFAASLQVQLQQSFVPSGMVLVNPAVDLRQSDNPMYQLVTKWYLNERSPNDSIVSPVLAKNISFFPPTLLITSEKDDLRSQGLEWRNKLAAAKVSTTWVDLPQQDHLGGLWAGAHPDARKAINATITFVNALPKPK